jgi:hypothetical protein
MPELQVIARHTMAAGKEEEVLARSSRAWSTGRSSSSTPPSRFPAISAVTAEGSA